MPFRLVRVGKTRSRPVTKESHASRTVSRLNRSGTTIGEALYSILAPANRVALAAGGGMLHEADGVNVLLARFVGGINTALLAVAGGIT